MVLVRPGRRERSGRANEARDPPQRLFRPTPRRARRSASTTRSPAACIRSPATSRRDGLGLDEAGPRNPRLLRHRDPLAPQRSAFDAPLDGAVEVNLLGPSRVAETLSELAAERATGRRSPLPHLISVSTAYVNSGHNGDAAEELDHEPRHSCRRPTGGPRSRPPAAPVRTRTPRAAARSAWRASTRRRAPELGAAGTALLAETNRAAPRASGSTTAWSQLGRGRAQALGWPDAYAYTKSLGRDRSPATCAASCPSPSSGPRSSSPRSPSPAPGGSAASAWPSRSSSPTPGACSASSPAFPRASSTSSPSTSSSPRSSPSQRSGPDAAGPTRLPGRVWRPEPACATDSSSSSCERVVHRASPLRQPRPADRRSEVVVPRPGQGPGRAPPCHANCSAPQSGSSTCSRSVASWRRPAPGSRSDERRPSGRSATSSSTAPTPRPRRAFGSTARSSSSRALEPADRSAFCFDPAVIDWRHYVEEVHLPSVVAHARVRTVPRKADDGEPRGALPEGDPVRASPAARCSTSSRPSIDSNVVESYAWLATRHLDRAERARVVAG